MKYYLEVTLECESAEQVRDEAKKFPLFEGNPPVVEVAIVPAKVREDDQNE